MKRNLIWRAVRLFGCFAVLMAGWSVRASAQTQFQSSGLLREAVHEFIGLGGYWFTSSSAKNALGSPKFGGTTTLFVKPAHRQGWLVTGGIELFGASDHWLIGGGNSFDLTGLSFKIYKKPELNKLAPRMTAGIFSGHIKSVREDFSETKIVPSMEAGADYKFHRYMTLSARYRVSGHIAGINTDGFLVTLKFF